MNYTNYTPVQVWKDEAKSLGLSWSDVRACFQEIKAFRREYDCYAREVRRRVFSTGVTKSHTAFYQGDSDRDSIQGFDVLAANVSEESPWACRSDDPGEDLYELISMSADDFRISDDEAWQQALQRMQVIQASQTACNESDEPF